MTPQAVDSAIVSVRGPNNTVFKGVDVPVRVEYKISGRKAQKFKLELFRQGRDGKQALVGEREVEHDGKERTEDGIIAYTWEKFLKGGDDQWPARLPMTKSAVRATFSAALKYFSTSTGETVRTPPMLSKP